MESERTALPGDVISGEGNRTLQWRDPETGETLRDSPSRLAAVRQRHDRPPNRSFKQCRRVCRRRSTGTSRSTAID
jgi:hypothetical protein